MRHDFSKVTLEDLAQLFPVILTEHNPKWSVYYQEEAAFLRSIFADRVVRMNHIGSSSIPGIIAKPTIDILLEVSEGIDLQSITDQMEEEGYVVNNPPGDLIMFLKGYTPKGFVGQAMHIHVRHTGDWGELYFRDYLIAHPEVAKEYEKLKTSLIDQYRHDRDGYTEAKGEFIREITRKAREEFSNNVIRECHT